MTIREQLIAQEDATRATIRKALTTTMLVEAGAGTGKTSALVDRVTALVCAGTPIERIVAITFTEKAAAELKDRVRSELERHRPADDDERARIVRAIGALDRAPISTIHAFGQTLMRQYAAEAAIDPAFAVSDALQEERRFTDAWSEELRRLALVPEACAAIERAMGLGMTTRDLRTLVTALQGQPEAAARLASVTPPDAVAWPSLAALRQRLEDLQLVSVHVADELRLKAEQAISLLARLEAAGQSHREYDLASAASWLTEGWKLGRCSNAPAWGSSAAVNAARGEVASVQAALVGLLAACRRSALEELLPFVARFVAEDAQRRRREGALSFDDLIHGPASLLTRHKDACRALRDRYDVMLIDEFQDTDPLQVDIALAFATDPDSGRIDDGRIFLVGDPKQSIYRFRRADMAVYTRTRDVVEAAGGAIPQLQLNRRSREVVIDWVNAVFERLIPAAPTPGVQPAYVPVHALRDTALKGPGVGVLGGWVDIPAARLRHHEAAQVAAWCQAAIEERWQVQDRATGETRDASLSDIAILIPTRAGLAALERALQEARIPFRVEGGSLIYQTQEVRDLINCLTAIDDPSDEVAIVAALRSSAFACSDVDLAHWRAAGKRFGYLSARDGGEGTPVALGLAALRRWHDERHAMPLAALVERFVAAFGLDETGMIVAGTRDTFRRMRFVVEQARAFEANGPESLRSFCQWMESRTGVRVFDHEGSGLDDDELAVRILTMHGGKGLEFPIVFLAGLSAQESNQPPTLSVDRMSDAVAVRIGSKQRYNVFASGDVDRLHALEAQHSRAERRRLLYVGATRARDHLLVSLYHNTHQSKSLAKLIIDEAGDAVPPSLPERTVARGAAYRPFAGVTIDANADPEALPAERASLVARAVTERYTSATAIKQQLAEDRKDERADESEPWARGRGGTRLGRAVHATIQSLPWSPSPATIEAHARAQAVAEAIPDRSRDVAELARRALASDAAIRARAARRALREVPFGLALDGTIIEGFIDLLIEGDDGLEIVDWKTDRVTPAAVEERLRTYELQAGLYVLGIEAATRRQVRRISYVFVSAGVERSPGDPRELAERARQQVAAVT